MKKSNSNEDEEQSLFTDDSQFAQENSAVEKTGFFTKVKLHIRRSRFYYAIILLLIVFMFYSNYRNNVKLEKLSESHNTEINAIGEEYKTVIRLQGEEYLSLMAKTFSWAIRSELIKENYDQVNLYIIQLIKEKGVVEIAVIDNKGLIVASSNKKQEGESFEIFYNKRYLSSSDVQVEQDDSGLFLLSSPVMSFNNRIGTVFITFDPKAGAAAKMP